MWWCTSVILDVISEEQSSARHADALLMMLSFSMFFLLYYSSKLTTIVSLWIHTLLMRIILYDPTYDFFIFLFKEIWYTWTQNLYYKKYKKCEDNFWAIVHRWQTWSLISKAVPHGRVEVESIFNFSSVIWGIKFDFIYFVFGPFVKKLPLRFFKDGV